jgi:translation elongation factor P/translation initiation factor 5A
MLKVNVVVTLFFISLSSYALDFDCPKESYKVDFFSSEYKLRKLICFKSAGSGKVKHGREVHLNLQKNIVLDQSFLDGVEIKQASASSKGKKQLNTSYYLEAIKVVTGVVNSSNYRADKKLGAESFNNKRCQGNSSDFIKLFLFNKDFLASYKFSEECDLQGTWSPRMKKYFDVKFKLKDLLNFDRVSLKIKFELDKSAGKFRMLIKEGSLSGKESKLNFTATFDGDLDVQKSMIEKRLIFKSQNGIVMFKVLNGKAVNIERSFVLN